MAPSWSMLGLPGSASRLQPRVRSRKCVLLERGSLVAQLIKNPPATWESWVRSLGWEDALEKGKATHSSILAWRIPWMVHEGAKSWTWPSNFHFHFFECGGYHATDTLGGNVSLARAWWCQGKCYGSKKQSEGKLSTHT